MLDVTNTIVQALVWTTLAGLLYAVWLRSETTAKYKIDLSFYWQQVVEVLQWLWVLLAIGLVISMVIFAWPRPTSAATPPPAQACIPSPASLDGGGIVTGSSLCQGPGSR